jgi:anti-sigma B factor antagonist
MMGGPDTVVFHDNVKRLISKNVNEFVVDLRKVKWLNSSGLGVLMSSWGSVCRINGVMKLANVTQKVRSLLIVTQIITFFETYDTVDEAIKSFKRKE